MHSSIVHKDMVLIRDANEKNEWREFHLGNNLSFLCFTKEL